MILVTGATGSTGSEVVRALRDRGARVRAFVRDPDRARQLLDDGVQLATGDFADPQSVRASGPRRAHRSPSGTGTAG